jgi:ubiquinone/menaquinone biosynthesis C-methylase UbiE
MSRQGEARQPTIDNIKDFWNNEAAEWGESPRVTIRDHYLRLLEISRVAELVKGRENVLDIGCGTVMSTLFYAGGVGKIIGADFAENMIRWAQRFLEDREYFDKTMGEYAPDGAPLLTDNVSFQQGDITGLSYGDAEFDAVIGERVLINLPDYELQDKAVAEVARVLKPGGRFVMVEVTVEGHAGVDRVRDAMGLPQIEKYWHNKYVDEARCKGVAEANGLELQEVHRFETYQFLSKVLHPLAVAPAEPEFMTGLNDAARQIAARFPDYASVSAVGLEKFLKEEFRPELERLDPDKLEGYDRVVAKALEVNPDFTGCSHQVLFVLERK